MVDSFGDIVNVGYTAGLEEELDRIEEGSLNWKEALAEFLEKFEKDLERARRELPKLFPGADFGSAGWASFRVDRAEWAGADGRLPGGPVVQTSGSYVVAWPTKLALAPALAERIVGVLHDQGVRPAASSVEALAALPSPEVAPPPWAEVRTWH